jgi:hypothetical protein
MRTGDFRIRRLIWLAVSLGAVMVAITLALYGDILRHDGSASLFAQVKSDGANLLGLFAWVILVSFAIWIVVKLLSSGFRGLRRHPRQHLTARHSR